MGKEVLTLEVDAELMDKVRAAGLDPQTYVARLLEREAAKQESATERAARHTALRAELQPGLDAYDAFIERHGLWSDGLRPF